MLNVIQNVWTLETGFGNLEAESAKRIFVLAGYFTQQTLASRLEQNIAFFLWLWASIIVKHTIHLHFNTISLPDVKRRRHICIVCFFSYFTMLYYESSLRLHTSLWGNRSALPGVKHPNSYHLFASIGFMWKEALDQPPSELNKRNKARNVKNSDLTVLHGFGWH